MKKQHPHSFCWRKKFTNETVAQKMVSERISEMLVKDFYEEWREKVEEGPIHSADTRVIISALSELDEVGVILDLGCGYGRHMRLLEWRGVNVVGVDLALNLLKKAKYYGDVINADLQFMPFKENAFTIVLVMYGPLNHIHDLRNGLIEIRRVTVRGLIGSVYNMFSRYGCLSWIGGPLTPITFLLGRIKEIVHVLLAGVDRRRLCLKIYTAKALFGALHDCGFELERWEGQPRPFHGIHNLSPLISFTAWKKEKKPD